jgi:2-methylthioadenine synthetase
LHGAKPEEELTDVQPLVDVLAGPDAYRQLPMLIRNAMLSQEEGLDQKGLAVDLSEYETYHDVIPDRNDGVNAGSPSCEAAITSAASVWSLTLGGVSALAIRKESCRRLGESPSKDSSRSRSWDKTSIHTDTETGISHD